MNKIVCIFAHPDDEAFGPGGTIALLAEKHVVDIICVTNGDAGKNSSREDRELSAIRREELINSTNILGVNHVYFLDYNDGSLCNNLYHEIADKIVKILHEIQPDTLMTFEPRGVSGHVDHMTVSMITSYVFERLPFIEKLMYYCIDEKNRALQEPYFIYFPPGYSEEEIAETFDITSVREKKVASMKAHVSQSHDAERVLRKLEKLPKKETFLVITKTK